MIGSCSPGEFKQIACCELQRFTCHLPIVPKLSVTEVGVLVQHPHVHLKHVIMLTQHSKTTLVLHGV